MGTAWRLCTLSAAAAPDEPFAQSSKLPACHCLHRRHGVGAADSPPPAQGSDQDSGPTFTVSDLPVGRPLRIIVYGDMRFTDPANTSDTQPGVRKWLAQKVGEEKPDLLLLTGDMPFHGSSADDWKIYFQETALWTQERLRIYPTIGNHEGLPDPRAG